MANHGRTLAGFGFLVLTILIVTRPQLTYAAALAALTTWWRIVLPALLPFLLASHLMQKLGIIDFLGVFLEPLTRPLFNLPGQAAIVITMGYSSGPPVAACLVADLRRRRLLTRSEGERLLCFTHNASPLFLLGALPVGMLGSASLGPPLAAAHYLANITLGFLWRWHGREAGNLFIRQPRQRRGYWRRAMTAMQQAQRKENCPLGGILAEAIRQSFRTLILVGGYIVMAGVALALLSDLRLLSLIARSLGALLAPFSLSPSLGEALAKGLLEMTLGTQDACETAAPLLDRLIVASIILGLSGLSIYGQVASVLAGTDIRLAPFLLSRLAQGILAACYLPLFLPPGLPALLPLYPLPQPGWTAVFGQSLRLLAGSLALPAVAALVYHVFKQFWPSGS